MYGGMFVLRSPPEAPELIVFAFVSLLVEASRVIDMRLRMMALGNATPDEMLLMVTEKIDAAGYAGQMLLEGGNLALVIDNYRNIVAANVERLSVR